MAFVSVGKKIMIRSLQRRNERGFFRKRGGSFSLVLIISRLVYFSPTTSLLVSSASETPRVIGLMESESGTGWFKICICKFVHVKDRLRFRVNLENGRNIPCNKYGTKLERETCLVLEFFQLLGES